MQKCEDELNSHYGSYAANNTFIDEFNAVNSCGIIIYKKTTKSVKLLQVVNEE